MSNCATNESALATTIMNEPGVVALWDAKIGTNGGWHYLRSREISVSTETEKTDKLCFGLGSCYDAPATARDTYKASFKVYSQKSPYLLSSLFNPTSTVIQYVESTPGTPLDLSYVKTFTASKSCMTPCSFKNATTGVWTYLWMLTGDKVDYFNLTLGNPMPRNIVLTNMTPATPVVLVLGVDYNYALVDGLPTFIVLNSNVAEGDSIKVEYTYTPLIDIKLCYNGTRTFTTSEVMITNNTANKDISQQDICKQFTFNCASIITGPTGVFKDCESNEQPDGISVEIESTELCETFVNRNTF